MSNLWLNIRILLWHLQIVKGSLFRLGLYYNPWWWRRELLWKPMWVYSCDLVIAWECRKDTTYRAFATGQKHGP